MLGYSFEVHFKPGSSNRVADALSRKNARDIELGSLLTTQTIDWTKVKEEINSDSLLKQIRQDLLPGTKEHTFRSA